MAGLGFQFNQQFLFDLVPRAAVLLLCLPIHEFAHAYAAYKLGDKTAAERGRLTLNPFAHLDLIGSALLLFAGFGWAKPVPVRAEAFRHPRRGMALVAAAGPLSNILMATLIMAIFKVVNHSISVSFQARVIFEFIILINLILAVFNLLPIPPLDGSKFFGAVLPDRFYFGMMRYERFVMIGLIALMLTGVLGDFIFNIAGRLFLFVDFITRPIDMLMGG